MDRKDIPEILFSSIKEDDPYGSSKLLQIERWCYAHWKLHKRNVEIGHNFIAQVLSRLCGQNFREAIQELQQN